LWERFPGPNNVDDISSIEEARRVAMSYTGERKKWTWEKYFQIHYEQHAVLNGLIDYGYSSIDNGTKFHTLMTGINNNSLETIKATVLANPALHSNNPNVVIFMVTSSSSRRLRART
jgi:hypothetical protein